LPLYDYECGDCGHVYELRQSFDAEPEGVCPRCAGMSRRKFHAVPIIYKGSGFYSTDYKRSSNNDSPVSAGDKEGTKEETEAAKATTGSAQDKKDAKVSDDGSSGSKKKAAKEA